MDFSALAFILAAFSLALSFFIIYNWNLKSKPQKKESSFSTKPLQLQAYERLVVLAERIAIPNLVGRINNPDLSAKEMQLLLLSHIKQEFEYNCSQQIYVKPSSWQSIQKLKDQNMLIINQVAQTLTTDAKAFELNRTLLEIILKQDKNSLHIIVLDALNYEARKLMQ